MTDEDLLRLLNHPPLRSSSCLSGPQEICECPSTECYLNLALGSVTTDEADELMAHAMFCDVCGEKLAKALRIHEDEPNAQEYADTATVIASIGVDKGWQRELARKLASTDTPKEAGTKGPELQREKLTGVRTSFGLRTYCISGSIAAGLVAAGGLVIWQSKIHEPEYQIAMAYSESRTLELRIPEASYAEPAENRHTRGAIGDTESSPLLYARAQLQRQIEKSPEDRRTLELKARADVLGERYDSAVKTLDHLLTLGPPTSELLGDAATAYYARGLATGSQMDRSTALEYLRRADGIAPTDPVILFNEAIVMEDRGQMMNAVEVWHRYLTVERDTKWATEGQRRLAQLEQTLDRFKTHASRVDGMLATPEAMDALARDQAKLGMYDEELATYQLDRLFTTAFPTSLEDGTANSDSKAGEARGSPCDGSCKAARRLLKALGGSLESQHKDYWLTDLLSVDIDNLQPQAARTYSRALRALGQATREEAFGTPAESRHLAVEARGEFERLRGLVSGQRDSVRSARMGIASASLVEMITLQRDVAHRDCRIAAARFRDEQRPLIDPGRYGWMDAVESITENSCDDTPETRDAGIQALSEAMKTASEDHYWLLATRVEMAQAYGDQNAGDMESATRRAMATFHDLWRMDAPPLRITSTIGILPYAEANSARVHAREVYLREVAGWSELMNSRWDAANTRMALAHAELVIGNTAEAVKQLEMARREGASGGNTPVGQPMFIEADISFAATYLERDDLKAARSALESAARYMPDYSDTWGLRAYASARGQLELASGELKQAEDTLEAAIRNSEGNSSHDRANLAEYAEQDHDLYAELAAVWLAQHRRPDSILALWERFRLRSRGLPVSPCREGKLDCEVPKLLGTQRRLGSNSLVGQILLLDRVLIYRMDRDGLVWQSSPIQRRNLLDTAKSVEQAASSPLTSLEDLNRISSQLAGELLPLLPTKLDGALLIESDPMLMNMVWPVLPVPGGSLGLVYPVAQSRSILAEDSAVTGAMAASREVGSAELDRPLMIGASIASGELETLPEASAEARSVGQFFWGSQVLEAKRATRSNVATALGTASIFHFAGHAVQTTRGTELMLSPGSAKDKSPWIDAGFLRSNRPNRCRLAVLSACATGTLDATWNHPSQDLVETFSELGVPEVVATRWQIDSGAAVPLMDHFYRGLAQGDTAAVAMQEARKLQFADSRYKNPYYWGAYYVTGNETRGIGGELHASKQE